MTRSRVLSGVKGTRSTIASVIHALWTYYDPRQGRDALRDKINIVQFMHLVATPTNHLARMCFHQSSSHTGSCPHP